jgi:hypothetical protein
LPTRSTCIDHEGRKGILVAIIQKPDNLYFLRHESGTKFSTGTSVRENVV